MNTKNVQTIKDCLLEIEIINAFGRVYSASSHWGRGRCRDGPLAVEFAGGEKDRKDRDRDRDR